MTPRLFCALDTGDLAASIGLASALYGAVDGLKLGLEFFCAHGPEGIRRLGQGGAPIFLDLKLHDIPNTVAGAVTSLAGLPIAFLTLHASGGPAMIAAANAATSAAFGERRPKLLAVTVLTSLDADTLDAVGQDPDAARQVERLARMAMTAGADGVVCSAREVARLRTELPLHAVLVVPGIRPEGAEQGDQKRVATPQQAARAGADLLVIGRPITQSPDPRAAALTIRESLARSLP